MVFSGVWELEPNTWQQLKQDELLVKRQYSALAFHSCLVLMTAQPQRNSRHLLKRTAWPSDQSKGELRSPKDCLEKSTQNNCHHAGKPLKSLFLYMRKLLWLQIIDSLVFVLRMKARTITLWLNTLQAYVLREIFTFCILYVFDQRHDIFFFVWIIKTRYWAAEELFYSRF